MDHGNVQHENNQIVQGVIWRQLLIFFFPIFFGTIFQQLYNTVDAIIVGRVLGKAALAAVGGVTTYLVNIFLNFFIGLCAGATVVIAQYYGAENEEKTSQSIHTAMLLSIVAGALMSLCGLRLAPIALALMKTPPEIMVHASVYLRIYYSGFIFSFVYNMGSSVMRAMGDSRRPFYMLVTATLINIAFDILFVVKMGMGVDGAAYATVLSQAVSSAGVCIFLIRQKGPYRLTLRGFRGFHWPILRNIIRIGVPTGLQSITYAASNLFVQTTINSFGVDLAAAWSTYAKIDRIYWLGQNALNLSVCTFSGQNFGARKYDRVYKSIITTTYISLFFSFTLGFAIVHWSELLYSIFTNDPDVITKAVKIAWMLAPWYFLYVPIDSLAGGIRGTGDILIPTTMTLLGVCGTRLLWVFCVVPFSHTETTVFLSYPISWGITSVFFLIYAWKGNWMRRSIDRAGHQAQD